MKTKSFTKKAFGADKKIIINLDDKGLPVTVDKNDFLILGIPSKLFQSKEATKEECKIALINYKIEIQNNVIEAAEAKLKEANDNKEILLEEIVEIETGKPSKKKIEKEKAKLLARLAELEQA